MARRGIVADDAPKAKVTKDSLKKVVRVFKYFRPYKLRYSIGLVFLLLTSSVALVFPMQMKDLIDAATSGSLEEIDTIAVVLLVIFLAQSIFSYFRIFLFVHVTENALADLRKDTYEHLIKLPMSFFAQRRVGELNSRLSSDISMLSDTFTTTIAEFIRQLTLIIGGIIFLAFTSVKLTLVMLSVIPVVALLAVFFGRKIRKVSKETQDAIADSNTIIEETMQGISNVKAFANEAFEIARYRKGTKKIVTQAMKSAKARGAFASFIILCLFGSIILVIWRGVHLVATNPNEFSMGSLVQFILYSGFVGVSFGGIAELYSSIQKAIGATERIFEIMDEQPEQLDIHGQTTSLTRRLDGIIAFENVSFRYPSRPEVEVLKKISFSAKKGQTIALVGPSGSGKSTIAAMVLRFYNPENGRILIDGTESNSYPLTELRNQMAIVPQDVLLFGGTIKENIAYGKPGATLEEIKEAAKKANAHDFIEGFPEKYETVVGERGIKLSGGQRQRIAIARAVLKNPSILILDEATSSLDSESERLVQDALDKLMVGRTSIVIAHRLSTIKNADQIIVIEHGTVRESGTHEELSQKEDGLYRNLSRLQFELA